MRVEPVQSDRCSTDLTQPCAVRPVVRWIEWHRWGRCVSWPASRRDVRVAVAMIASATIDGSVSLKTCRRRASRTAIVSAHARTIAITRHQCPNGRRRRSLRSVREDLPETKLCEHMFDHNVQGGIASRKFPAAEVDRRLQLRLERERHHVGIQWARRRSPKVAISSGLTMSARSHCRKWPAPGTTNGPMRLVNATSQAGMKSSPTT